jgi:hypothetical protein
MQTIKKPHLLHTSLSFTIPISQPKVLSNEHKNSSTRETDRHSSSNTTSSPSQQSHKQKSQNKKRG